MDDSVSVLIPYPFCSALSHTYESRRIQVELSALPNRALLQLHQSFISIKYISSTAFSIQISHVGLCANGSAVPSLGVL